MKSERTSSIPSADWFEMKDLERPQSSAASWIPLRRSAYCGNGRFAEVGYVEEYRGDITILLPISAEETSRQLEFGSINNYGPGPDVHGERYRPAGKFDDDRLALEGEFAVLAQWNDAERAAEWYLHQDLLLSLALKREGDCWVRPEEDFAEVARLHRDGAGEPIHLEMRAEHFRDYLQARGMGAVVVSFVSRRAVLEIPLNPPWPTSDPERDFGGGRWKGLSREVDRSGNPPGTTIGVFVASRQDPELGDDVPVLDPPNDTNLSGGVSEFRPKGPFHFYVVGELRRNEWIAPGAASPRVRRDSVTPTHRFIVAADGSTAGPELAGRISWLWFHPGVAMDILRRRGSRLCWYSSDTGGLFLLSSGSLHFGVNALGLVNVFAKDIINLPEATQRLWLAHNVTPDGGVSDELIAAQMHVTPAATVAPERRFVAGLAQLDQIAEERLGSSLLRSHPDFDRISREVHRFRCAHANGIESLCKDITRLVADRLDIGLLRRLVPSAPKTLGSLKLLETYIGSLGLDGHQMVGPLFAAYDLRLDDAHLPAGERCEARAILGIDAALPPIQQGKSIIHAVANTIERIASGFRESGPRLT